MFFLKYTKLTDKRSYIWQLNKKDIFSWSMRNPLWAQPNLNWFFLFSIHFTKIFFKFGVNGFSELRLGLANKTEIDKTKLRLNKEIEMSRFSSRAFNWIFFFFYLSLILVLYASKLCDVNKIQLHAFNAILCTGHRWNQHRIACFLPRF